MLRAISYTTRPNKHQNAICPPLYKRRWFKHWKFYQQTNIWNQSTESNVTHEVKTTKLFRHRKITDHKLWKRKWVFLRLQRRGQITLKICFIP